VTDPVQKKLLKLIDIIATLRSPHGCPWDRKQTHKSLKPYVIEEAYEVLAALDENNPELLKEELGDLLLQIVLHAQLASENKKFNLADVIDTLNEKMIRRHPHVFAREKIKNVKGVLSRWEAIKRAEKNNSKKSFCDGIPDVLPALYRAEKTQKKAARVGFDWEAVDGAWQKVQEELKELKHETRAKRVNKNRVIEELGDVLFSMVNVARKLHVDAEDALRLTTNKFMRRFEYIERKVLAKGKQIADCSLAELDRIWEESKKQPHKKN
jgi:tetrapyrrole methylase family protein / MazG family protein